jgi:hypothetical protein
LEHAICGDTRGKPAMPWNLVSYGKGIERITNKTALFAFMQIRLRLKFATDSGVNFSESEPRSHFRDH